ncbi:MAG TPA: phosphatase PAP2 family protein, partial [Acidimicrobiales bacterium]|nr:phosphatase PAP2 family protein [Acidimicrobiales bacterium]
MKTGTDRPPTSPSRAGRAGPRPRWWREVLYIAVFYGIYTAIRDTQGSAGGGTNGTSAVVAYHHARQVIHAERDLLLYHEQQLQHFFIAHLGSLTRPFFQFWDLWYGSAHFLVTIAVAIWLFRRDPARYTLMRNVFAATTRPAPGPTSASMAADSSTATTRWPAATSARVRRPAPHPSS